MTTAMNKNETALNTLSSVLYLSLDEVHFFNSISQFFKTQLNCDSVKIYKILENGKSILMSVDRSEDVV